MEGDISEEIAIPFLIFVRLSYLGVLLIIVTFLSLQKQKPKNHTTISICWWSPTQLLTHRRVTKTRPVRSSRVGVGRVSLG